MGRSLKKRIGLNGGGIISLARFVDEHREAVEYDLLTKTGYELGDVGSVLSWNALNSFIKNSDADSRLSMELEPDFAIWSTRSKTNAILADIFDLLAAINANIKALGSGKPAKKPEKYPRPKKNKKEKIFSSSMPASDLRKWFNERRQH